MSCTDNPNILFIITDEQRFDTLRCYGNNHVQAPNLNKLAEQSFVFERAYCTQPVCTASRASIFTGMWPHSLGGMPLNCPLPEETKTIAQMIDDNYKCAYMGKWHLGDEIIAQHGFSTWKSSEGGYEKYYSQPEYTKKCSDYNRYLIKNGFVPTSITQDGKKNFSRGFAASLDERHTKASFLAREASDFIKKQDGSNPFLLSVSFLEPHMPFFGPLNDLYDPDKIPLTPSFLKEPSNEATLRHRKVVARYKENGFHGLELTNWQWKRYKANYYGLITLVDRAVGQILEALEQSGQAENTIVVFTSDHGEMMGDHNLIGKTMMFEPSIRVPLLMRVPWLKNERQIKGNISQIDILPTLLELAGQHVPSYLQGSSRAKVLSGNNSLNDNEVVIEWNPSNTSDDKITPAGFTESQTKQVANQSWRTIIDNNGWKLNLSDNDINELYSINDDPYELDNKINDSNQQLKIKELTEKIYSWQDLTQDRIKI